MGTKKCSREGCGRAHAARGLCKSHYMLWRLGPRKTPCKCGCGLLTSYGYRWGHDKQKQEPKA